MQELISKAATLLEALPYIQRFAGATFVVKYGGSFMDSPDEAVRTGVARDVVFLEAVEINPVVVHGGGKRISRALEAAGMHLTDSALIAATHWSSTICETPDLFEALCQTQGGRNLVGLGFDSDISLCADVDSLNVVPQLDPDGLIRQT